MMVNGDGEHDMVAMMMMLDSGDGANGARHVEGLVKINLGLFKFSPALD